MLIKILKATCFSQDRKNQGKNCVYLRGERVQFEDESKGREVINILSRVTSRIAPTHAGDLVRLYARGEEIVIDARVEEEDVEGRRAGIAIHVKIPATDGKNFPRLVCDAASQFAKAAELTLAESVKEQIFEAVQQATQKNTLLYVLLTILQRIYSAGYKILRQTCRYPKKWRQNL